MSTSLGDFGLAAVLWVLQHHRPKSPLWRQSLEVWGHGEGERGRHREGRENEGEQQAAKQTVLGYGLPADEGTGESSWLVMPHPSPSRVRQEMKKEEQTHRSIEPNQITPESNKHGARPRGNILSGELGKYYIQRALTKSIRHKPEVFVNVFLTPFLWYILICFVNWTGFPANKGRMSYHPYITFHPLIWTHVAAVGGHVSWSAWPSHAACCRFTWAQTGCANLSVCQMFSTDWCARESSKLLLIPVARNAKEQQLCPTAVWPLSERTSCSSGPQHLYCGTRNRIITVKNAYLKERSVMKLIYSFKLTGLTSRRSHVLILCFVATFANELKF